MTGTDRVDLTSRLAARWVSEPDPPPWREFDGTMVLADLTGFTRLTEILADRHGAEGSELLHRSLLLCFSALLAPSLAAGGDVIGFAGDAALVYFDGPDHERRAAASALEMPANLARVPAALTGGKRVRVSVGVHTARFTAVLAGAPQRAVFFCGPEITLLAQLEATARAGQVVVGPGLARALPAAALGPATGPGFELRRGARLRPGEPPPSDARPVEADPPPWLALVSPATHALMLSDLPVGEHRAASVGFVAVPGLDALLAGGGPAAVHATLDAIARLIHEVATELGLAWLDVDIGAGYVKFLLAAGAPEAVDDDEHRLLFALRTILDRAEVPLRAGAQRGRIFAGALGVPARRSFTLLGDSVNIAARAMAQAGDGELVAADGLGLPDRADVRTVDLGAIVVKNHARPVPMWRVDEVQPRTGPARVRSTTGPIGRAAESEVVTRAWKRAADGAGSWLAVVGEPGMGGSELLAEAVTRAGATATFVVGDPYRKQVTYGIGREIVRSIAASAGLDGSDDDASWLGSFAGDLPVEMRSWVADGINALRQIVRPDDIDPESTARRAQEVIAALVGAAAPRPWLLAVDEIAAADDASIAVLRALRLEAERHPWLVLTASTMRSDAADARHTIELEPLGTAEATQVVLETAPMLRADQIERILAAAKGNPYVLAELALAPNGATLPDSLERLAAVQIDALPVEVRQAVRDASTFGSVLPLETVAAVFERPALAEVDAWRAAGSVLRRIGPTTLAFRHEAYRLAAHGGLTFQRRRELHGRIGDVLAAGPGPDAAVLARHYEEAGRAQDAYPLAVQAARAAAGSGALVDAADLIGRAAALARTVDRSRQGDLLAEHGELLVRIGDLDGAAAALTSAARLIHDPISYASLCSHRALLEMRRGRYPAARRWAHKGLGLLASSGGDELEPRVRLLTDEVAVLHYTGRNAMARPIAFETLEIARRTGDPHLIGSAHMSLEMVLSPLLDPRAVEHGDAAIACFERIGHHRMLASALLNSGLTEMFAGRWDEARSRYQRAARAAMRAGERLTAAIAELNEGFLLLRQGRGDEAEARAERSMRTFAASGLEAHVAYAHHLRSGIAAADGRFADAADQMAVARRAFETMGDQAMTTDCDVTHLGHLLLEGRAGEARQLAHELTPKLTRHEDEALIVMHELFLGLAEAVSGNAVDGAARVAAALARADHRHLPYETWRCLGALLEIEAAGGPTAPPGTARRHAELTASLDIVTPHRGS